MIDPFDELLRAEGHEAFAELYEAIAEMVCVYENAEYEARHYGFRVPEMEAIITLFNACESARFQLRTRIAEMATNGDDAPADLHGKGGIR